MKFSFPSAQTILFIIAGLVALLTWFVPAGQYDTLAYDSDSKEFVRKGKDGSTTLPATQQTLENLNIKIPLKNFTGGGIYKPIAIPGSYQKLDPKPQGVVEFLMSPIKGIIAAGDIIFFVLIIGGLIGIMNYIGAFNAGMAWLAEALKGKEYILIILITALIALGGTTFGLAEETIAFFPILIPIFLVAGYDAMVGLACIFLGSSIGAMCSTVNPFATIIASDAAGINWTTGLEGRIITLLILVGITIAYILRYAQRVKKDPTKSIVYDQKEKIESLFGFQDVEKAKKLTPKLKLILLLFLLCFVVMIYGVSNLHWWFTEMSTVFLVGAIVIGFIARIKESDFIEVFVKGAGELLGVAFIIGVARGVSVIMEDGLISDTMLYYTSGITDGMHKGLFANVMMILYGGLSFFIPSSSGMAVLTMPIMAPLADTVGVGREVVVNAYQYGLGLFYLINPTGLILASLAVVKLGFDRWLKFVMPLFIIILVTTMIILTITTLI